MDERVAAALAARYHRVFNREEDGGYSAFVLELPGVNAAGADIAEANQDLEDAIESWVEIELEKGHEIPEPLDPERYSGKTQLRIPPSLHHQAQMRASVEGISLNRFFSDAIAVAVGAKRP
ncbi:MAG: type II toxin-antitoxin system HicB family antitoxin [Dehalococcoidia bacterium]|nr:type II toxin-antitoxin system HicB family antitoxin [Dehalococcoidia bacterium]